MDYSQLDRRSMADVAQRLQFMDPDTGKPIDGVAAMIRGSHSRTVQAAVTARSKAELQAGSASDRKALEEVQQDLVQSAALVTVEILGVTDNGAAIDPAKFYDLNFFDADVMMGRGKKRPGSFAQQAMRFAHEVSNFLTPA